MNKKKEIKNLLNSFTALQTQAHVDLDTGKIYGAKRGSRSWWHEKGHIEFNKLDSTSSLKMWQGVIFLVWMISMTLAIMNKFMIWIALPMLLFYLGIDIYEEYWCNQYASRKLNRKVYK